MVGELDHLLEPLVMRVTRRVTGRLKFAVTALAIVSLIRGFPGMGEPRRLAAASTLADLQGVSELKTLFNRDVGKIRLLLLLSPT